MYIDFRKVCEEVTFPMVFELLKVKPDEDQNHWKGQFPDGVKFVVSKAKSLFLCPTMSERRGSQINFVAVWKSLKLRDAAIWIVEAQRRPHEPKRGVPDLELEYCPEMKEAGITEEEAKGRIGLVKTKSVLAGHIACRIEKDGQLLGYIGIKDKVLKVPKSIFAVDKVEIPTAFLRLAKG